MATLATRTRMSRLPKTGQSTSYADYDDGYYEKGNPVLPRFVDNGDNTITDRATNLMWVKDPKAMYGALAWEGAWAVASAYHVGDVLDLSGAGVDNYVCQVAHTSRPNDPAAFETSYSYVTNDWFRDSLLNDWHVLLPFTSPAGHLWENDTAYVLNDIQQSPDDSLWYCCSVANQSRPLVCPAFQEGYTYDIAALQWFTDGTDDFQVLAIFTSPTTINWAQSTAYVPNNIRKDTVDGKYYVCLVGHTSAGSGTFADDRTANPTYWDVGHNTLPLAYVAAYPANLSNAGPAAYNATMTQEMLDHPAWWTGPYNTLPDAYVAIYPTRIEDAEYFATMAADISEHPTWWKLTVWTDSAGNISRTSWAAALINCEGLDEAGYTDWKLPNALELMSIADQELTNPSINPLFTNCATDEAYWTSTTDTNSAGVNARTMRFACGYLDIRDKSVPNYDRTRPVRQL